MIFYFSSIFSPRVKTIVTVGAASLIVGIIASADWTPPPTPPPACPSTNPACNPPIHSGRQGQNKEGPLTLGAFGGPGGLLVLNGNVGIGTITPTAKLEVAGGSILISAPASVDARLEVGKPNTGNRNAYVDLHGDDTYDDFGLRLFRGNTGPNAVSQIRHRGTGDFNIMTQELASLKFWTDNKNRMTITSGGNVGIGTAEPGAKLDVAGSIKITGGSPGVGKVLTSDAVGLASWQTPTGGGGIGGSGTINQISKFTGPTTIGDSAITEVGGNVGIGTVNPYSRFTLVDSGADDTVWAKVGANVYRTHATAPTLSGISIGGSDSYAVGIAIENNGGNYTGIVLRKPNTDYGSLFRYANEINELGIISPGNVRINADGYVGPSPDVRIQDWHYNPDPANHPKRPGNVLLAINGGRVGIGTDSPQYQLELSTNSAAKPGGGSWTTASDARLKKNVMPVSGALDRMLQLHGVTFEWNEPEKQGNLTGTQMGMIAQEVEKIFPQWVGEDNNGYKNLTIRGFEALTVEAIRELKRENKALQEKNDLLEARIKALEDRIK